MAKVKVNDFAKELEAQAAELFERIKTTQGEVSDALQNVRRAEGRLKEKEEAEHKERIEREKKERLMEVLASDVDLAFHVGAPDHDETEEKPVAQKTEKKAEVKAEEPPAAKAEEKPEAKKAEPKAEIKAEEAPSEKAEPAAAETQKPKKAEPEIAAKPEVEKSAGGYQAHRIDTPVQGGQNAPRPQGQYGQGGYQQRPQGQYGQNSGYQQRPQGQQGGYQQRPQGQYGQNSGYQQRPQGQQGGYQQRPQGQYGQAGGYQQRPQGQYPQGGYQQRPQGQAGQGGYQQRPQGQYGQGGYQQRPQGQYGQGGYQQRPQGGYSQGGFDKDKDYKPGFDRQRPQGARPPQSRTGAPRSGTGAIAPVQTKERVSNYDPSKGAYARTRDEERKAKNKKTILKESAPAVPGRTANWDDDAVGIRRSARRKTQVLVKKPEPVVIEKAVMTTETITVKDLSEKIGKPAAEIIKKLFKMGIMATINQELNYDTCALVAADYNIELEYQLTKTFEDVLQESSDEADEKEDLVIRPPVVTIMGHVDHGKTSLLDAIRHTDVAEGEAGGITQHIGAYTVTRNGRQITFIDTPGHEAFTAMRARGAQVTDIVILVVAADDGIKPQTVEAINHAKAAEVPIVVAINKIDRPGADPERVKQQLTEHGLVAEEWGGQTICVSVSAKTGQNLDTLLEMVLLLADVQELKANPNRIARGTIIEAELDKGRGPVATVLVQNGTLKIGDTIVAGTAYGRVRAMMDDKGRRVTTAGPSQPVEVLGFSEVPAAGDIMNVAEIDKLSRNVAEERRAKQKTEQLKNLSKVTLDDLFSQIEEGQVKDLNIIVKADVQGSAEAVKAAIEKLSNAEVRVRCIHSGVGAITGSDIMFASASNAIIIGFNVRPDAQARATMEREKVDVRFYDIIYKATEDVEQAMKGMFKPVFKEVELGRASVRNTFKVSGVGTIAGSYVLDGKVARNAQARVVRDGVVVFDGKIGSLKRFKDDAREVAAGYECGIGFDGFNDVKEGDVIEAYVMEEVKR
ncbi:MAG TPA: translation initiation factor IF-2 [Clostridia bacterium]|nr:translation initiation factor IF-2 [Clostridia bacterium]